MTTAASTHVLFPSELLAARPHGTLFGYHHTDTGYINVVACGSSPLCVARYAASGPQRIGTLLAAGDAAADRLVGRYSDDGIEFRFDDNACTTEYYSQSQDSFSRNSGIIEVPEMLRCGAIIAGGGSVGSLVAVELAKAGVGRFLLCDNDVLSYTNVSRHQCGIHDVGRWKTHAIRDCIGNINPQAVVATHEDIVERVPKHRFDEIFIGPSVVVGCADNREGDTYANRIACLYGAPFVSIGLWERAFAGEVFWSIPGKTPCYRCFINASGVLSHRVGVNRRRYTHEESLSDVTFEPGLSVDIGFVSLIGVKLAIDLLRVTGLGRAPRITNRLSQYTLACNTIDPAVREDLRELFSYPLQVTRSIVVDRWESCDHCALVSQSQAGSIVHGSAGLGGSL